MCVTLFFFQAEGGIRDVLGSRGLGDVYKRELKSVIGDNIFTHVMFKGTTLIGEY
ncbi:hypothetical protein SGP16001_43580 [Shigella flexneri]|nr:hypothetical protein SGP16001_43580 [Shigella flexneri]